MKQLRFFLILAFYAIIEISAAQELPVGDYFAYDTRGFGMLNSTMTGKVEASKGNRIDTRFLEVDYELVSVGNNLFQNAENTCQVILRPDKDLEVYLINQETSLIESVFLFSKDQTALRDKWKGVRDALFPKVGQKAQNPLADLTVYQHLDGEGEVNKFQYEINEEENELEIYYFDPSHSDTYSKVAENTYCYSTNSGGFVYASFLRIFPEEKKVVGVYNLFSENARTFVAQLKTPPTKNEADDKKIQELVAFGQSHRNKARTDFLNGFESFTHAEAPLTKITEQLNYHFKSEYTILKVKLISKNWELERNDYGRVLRRLHTVLVYLKETKTGKCYIAFRYYGQEYDGAEYGDPDIYTSSAYYDVEDANDDIMLLYELDYEYEIPCTDVPK
ncbi:MAG: hypothetical protein EAZ55_09325 [Cytophagales bacterium]|nr:MAG: hypothetical protein EAZ55_09325 [Cytophagales bacterium]